MRWSIGNLLRVDRDEAHGSIGGRELYELTYMGFGWVHGSNVPTACDNRVALALRVRKEQGPPGYLPRPRFQPHRSAGAGG